MHSHLPVYGSILPTIRLGPIEVRFLITGENSAGRVAAFEVVVPAARRLVEPAHSHDHYKKPVYGLEGVFPSTVDGKLINVGRGKHSAFRGVPFIRFGHWWSAGPGKIGGDHAPHGLTPAPPSGGS